MALLTLEEAMGEEALGGPYAREALEIAQRIGAPDLVGPASVNIGIHALREGNQRLAAEYLGAALKEFASAENPISVSETIELIAELAERSDPASAARLLGGAAAYRADHAVSWQGQHAPRTKALDRRLEHSLGPAAYTASRQSGVELELRELTIEALLLAQAYGHPEDAPFDRETLTPALTSREQVVLRLMVDGKSDREIGAELFISPKTANRHVTSILAKLGCRNRTAAATKAHQLGLV